MKKSQSRNTEHTSNSRGRDEFHIFQIAKILKKHWMVVVAAGMAGLGAAIAIQLFTPPKFESSAQLLIMRKDARLAAKGLTEGNSNESEVKVTEEMLATHMQMIQSRSIVDGALNAENLSELPSIADHVTAIKKPCDYVIDNMIVSRGGKGQARTAHVLNVSMRSSSPDDAQTILRAIVAKYKSFLSTKFQDVNQEAASLIDQAQTQLASELEVAEKAYEEFRQHSSSLMWKKTGEETTNVHRVRYDTVLQEITTLQMLRAEASARLDAVQEILDGREASELNDLERLSVIDEKNLTRIGLLLMVQKGESESPAFQAEQPIRLAHARSEFESFAEMQLKEKALLTELGAQHPDVVSVRKQIESLQDFLGNRTQELKTGRSNITLDSATLFSAYYQLLKQDVVAMERREGRLDTLAANTLKLASEMVTDEIQSDSLRRDVQRKQDLFDAAVDRLRDINLAKDYGGFINEVLAEPETGIKVSPKLSMSLVVGSLLALFLCAATIGMIEYRDRRFRTIQDLREALQMPVLGRIPLEKDPTAQKRSVFNRQAMAGAGYVPQLLDPESRGADAFRMLRTSLVFGNGEEYRQVICVTSPSPGDGKSTTVANLAVSLGQLGRRVLVIDCDLRRPVQDKLFAVTCERGLTSALEANVDPTDLIVATTQKNVSLLSRGESVSNPAEFLATGEFVRFVDSLREKFDHIILDCPPVLSVVDALAPAAMSDGVMMVLRVERTTQLQAQAACASLRQAGAELEGVIVNGLTSSSMNDEAFGYGYDYSYGYDASLYGSESARKDSISSELASESGKRQVLARADSAFRRNGNSRNSRY